MKFTKDILRYDEQAIMRLRTLYRQYGYAQYRMSRFEEYELYSDNKAFLANGDIAAFTAGGRLMALRPDVTLSIVKNIKDDGSIKKLYYNENVYRSDGHDFREQMQVGLECIGEVDVYAMGEVVMLAAKSLKTLCENSRISASSCVDVSHMGFIAGLMRDEDLSDTRKNELIKRISEKNTAEINSLCVSYGVGAEVRDRLSALAKLYGPYDAAMPELEKLSVNDETGAALADLEALYKVLSRLGAQSDINLDFSIVNDMGYYNGIIFQGYIEGIPAKALSGGRYDKLLSKFGKRSGAVGFAVFLDLLERQNPPRGGPEVDVLLLYGDETDPVELADAVSSAIGSGLSVLARRDAPTDVKFKSTTKL